MTILPCINIEAKKRTTKVWTEEEISHALADIEAGQSIRSVSKRCGVSASGLRKRRDMLKEGKTMVGSGRHPCLDKEQEKRDELEPCASLVLVQHVHN